MAGEDRRVLCVADSEQRARALAGALEATRESFVVEWSSDTLDASDRLARPDVDCLVVTAAAPAEIEAFVRTVRGDHPVLPIVYFGEREPTAVLDWTVVTGAVEAAVPRLAEHVEGRLAERDRRREAYDLDGTATAVRYPNVSDDRLDEMLEGGVDRETLQELYHKAQLLDAIFERLSVHLFVKDENGRHRYISSGYFEDDVEEFIDLADPEMDMVAHDHAWRAFEEDMYVIEAGEALVDKEEYLAKPDQWNLTSKVPWKDEDGETVGLIGVTRDISKWKRREQEIRRQNERLSAFSELVSHDLRNPLQVARSALTLAQESCDSDHLDRVERAHDRMDELIDDVLTLARYGQTVLETEPISLEASVIQAWGTVGDDRSTMSVADDLGTVECDPNQLQRLLENLFRNSVEHGAATDGTVSVRVESITEPAVNQPGSEPRRGFAVEDSGPGIPAEEREKILEPGYSTATDGTGFGLAIVAEIVDAHGWTLSITESDDGGARFEITGIEYDEPP